MGSALINLLTGFILNEVMMRYLMLSIGLALTMPAIAEAQVVTWKDDVRGWYIGVDRSVSDGCYMHSGFVGGGVMRVGFDAGEQNIFVVIGGDNWKSLEIGKLYPISFQFGSRSPWTVEAGVWEWSDGDKSLRFTVDLDDVGTAFITELQQMQNITVRYEGEQILNLALKGSFAAMEEVMNCQANMREGVGGNSDPFSSGSGSVSDPFR